MAIESAYEIIGEGRYRRLPLAHQLIRRESLNGIHAIHLQTDLSLFVQQCHELCSSGTIDDSIQDPSLFHIRIVWLILKDKLYVQNSLIGPMARRKVVSKNSVKDESMVAAHCGNIRGASL